QQPTEGELDLLFEAMYNDYFGGQPSANVENVLLAQEPQVRQTSTASTTIADNVPIPTNSSSHATNIPITSQDLNPNAMFDGNTFVNPFATSSSNAADTSSSQNVDPSNMHTFYQPYPHEFQWTKDHPLEQVIGEPSRPVLTRNQLRSDGDMCIYALTVSTTEPKNVKEAMTDPAWIESMQEELFQFKRMDERRERDSRRPPVFTRIGKKVVGDQTADLQYLRTYENNGWCTNVHARLGSYDVHDRLGRRRSFSESPPSSDSEDSRRKSRQNLMARICDSSDNEDEETRHWKSKNGYRNQEDEDMSRPWRHQKVDAFTQHISDFSEDKRRRRPANVKLMMGQVILMTT
nr:reverse transcriptase domain-containing protein [Tanacetum cinerariifolium]